MPTPVIAGSHFPGAVPLAGHAVGIEVEAPHKHSAYASPELEAEPANSSVPYEPPEGWCREHKGNGDACRAKPIKGTDLCVGHTRKVAAATARAEAAAAEPKE